MRNALFAPVLAALAFAVPAGAGTTPALKGVVIARMPAQSQLVVAGAAGRTTTLHATSLPAVGTVVQASAGHVRVLGRVHRAHFRGVLVRAVGARSFYAVGHGVVVVRTARSLASARASSLAPGDAAEIEVEIEADGVLDQTAVTPTPAYDATEVMLQVTITAVTPATATTAGSLTLSINGQPLVIPLPAGTVLPPAFVPNATVGVKIELKQPGARVEEQGDDDRGEDDHPATTTATGTLPPAPTTTTTTTTATTTTSSDRHDGHGGRDGGHDGGGDD